jgi:NTP pyrophosphatase (non-canonical NTP hydrolase)
MPDSLQELRDLVLRFRDERDWAQFHQPKELVAGLQIEAAELAELFLWKTSAQVDAEMQDEDFRERLADELADVQTFLLYLAHASQVNLDEAVRAKLAKNAQKYPVEKARGSAKKYDQL